MNDDRELIIKFKKVYVEDKLSHWVSTIEFDGEQVYEETGASLGDAGNRIYGNIWDNNSVIPDSYRFHEVPNPLKEQTWEEKLNLN